MCNIAAVAPCCRCFAQPFFKYYADRVEADKKKCDDADDDGASEDYLRLYWTVFKKVCWVHVIDFWSELALFRFVIKHLWLSEENSKMATNVVLISLHNYLLIYSFWGCVMVFSRGSTICRCFLSSSLLWPVFLLSGPALKDQVVIFSFLVSAFLYHICQITLFLLHFESPTHHSRPSCYISLCCSDIAVPSCVLAQNMNTVGSNTSLTLNFHTFYYIFQNILFFSISPVSAS